MNLFQTSILLSLLVDITLGIAVFATNPRRLINQSFLFLSCAIVAWLSCMFMGAIATSEVWLQFWIRQSSAAGVLLPPSLIMLRLSILNPRASLIRIIWMARGWFSISLPLAVLCQTPWFLHGAHLPTAGQTVGVPDYGPAFAPYALYYVGALVALIARFVTDARHRTGIQRTEIQFVLLGCILSLCVAAFLFIIPNLVGNPEIGLFLPLSDTVRVGVIAYAIATRRVMDVPHILRRMAAYLLMAIYLSTLYLAVWAIAGALARTLLKTSLPLAHLLATLTCVFSVAPVHGQMQRLANLLFVNLRAFDISDTLQRTNRVLSSITTLDDLLEQFCRVVGDCMGTDRVVVLLANEGQFVQRYPRTSASSLLTLHVDDALVITAARDPEPLVTDLLARQRPSLVITRLQRQMQQMQVAVAVGIHAKNQLQGLILLGPRLSGRIYGAMEQRALTILATHLATAVENAKLYTQVQDSMIYNNILLDNLLTGVVAVNTDRKITVFNREAQRITGLTSADVLHRRMDDILPAAFAHTLSATFETETGLRDHDLSVDLNGHSVPVRVSSTLFQGHAGDILGAMLIFTDLTRLRQLEMQVRRTDRLASLGTLSAGMAHEIKNPLVTLRTFTQLLPERYDDPDFRTTFSQLIGHEVKRIDSIVNQLLRFARPTKPSLVPTRVHDVVENTLRLVEQPSRQRGITVVRDLRAAEDLILADADLLTQAFLNLFLNAIEAMNGDAGILTVSSEIVEMKDPRGPAWGSTAGQPAVVLRIRDSGCGIHAADLPHVFDPFFTTKSSGTGLGLSVSHGIIQEHHGTVDVESEVGQGTTFSITFPLQTREAVV